MAMAPTAIFVRRSPDAAVPNLTNVGRDATYLARQFDEIR